MTLDQVQKLKLDFLKWMSDVDENATTSGDVAGFSRPIFSQPFKRNDVAPLLNEKDKKKSKKKKKKKH